MNRYKAERIREKLIPAEVVKKENNVVSFSPIDDFNQGSDYFPAISQERFKNEIENKKLSDAEILFELEKYKYEKLAFEQIDTLTVITSDGKELFVRDILFNFFDAIGCKGILDEEEDLVRDREKLTTLRAVKKIQSWWIRILKLKPPTQTGNK